MTKAVTLLGTGLMGAGMARSLLRAGLAVTVWNRSADKARPLADDGATVAADPVSAVAGADVVVTMLFDAESVEEVMAEAIGSLKPGAVWVQSATVGLDGVEALAALAAKHNVPFLDAPVLGTRQPAEEGKLIVLAGGDPALRPSVDPVFEAIGARTLWVGPRIGDGHRLKLAANSWVLSLTAGTAQALALTRNQGLDPQLFLDLIAGGGLDNPYAQLKGRAMIADEFPASFSLDGAVKDAGLIAAALRAAGADDRLMTALHQQYGAAAEAGHGSSDMAAVFKAHGEAQ
ncbi:NAD(P)-dependent oxidoreductase [Kutzneria sp. CA-103260]|uniref:NAD(P)-dependent oxidoreductase n=1 Tax=Kutzneria sp. CA-103260 TaxID=2802641 RepID=UPI001BA70F83|nr:NAD(P)-dependent oxidoreductase [Kutzneria sp. CA-103260]QUQ62985.1 3-hydroxyisobutyrate dehydrogenase [Kutzneria sp. CA-103260]